MNKFLDVLAITVLIVAGLAAGGYVVYALIAVPPIRTLLLVLGGVFLFWWSIYRVTEIVDRGGDEEDGLRPS